MGLKVRCFLDDVQMQVPINVRDIQLSIPRDPVFHGMQFEASTLALNFIGDAYQYLKEKKRTAGIKANVTCKIEQTCSDGAEWEEVLNGRLNISKWDGTGGISCMIGLPIEEDSCTVTLNNKMDQQVDIDAVLAQDRMSPLQPYFSLGLDMEIPTKALDYKTEGYVADEGDVEPLQFPDPGQNGSAIFIRPDFKDEKAANIVQSELTGAVTVGYSLNGLLISPSPEILYDEPKQQCFSEKFHVTGRLKGTINLPTAANVTVYGRLRIGEINVSFPFFDPVQDIQGITFGTYANPNAIVFDWTLTPYDWAPVADGKTGLYFMVVIFQPDGTVLDGNVTFDEATFINVKTLKTCPPTQTKAYLIHETVSRIVESVTNNCIRFKSEYYGRKDSEPFDFPSDGCGGLRFLTSGLKLRNAANPTFFASLQDILVGLQAIDNIGMGVEPDPDNPGQLLMRWEDLDFFYRNEEIFSCPNVPLIKNTYNLSKIWSTIQVGYEKWETQANFGLDEINSTREYRTDIDSLTSILKITSKLVAGPYPIEVTREQQFVDTSEADTAYDNDTFIVCLKRIAATGYPYGEMVVEQGNVSNPENIFSPSSVINYGISPVRNLLRWFRSIAAAYPNIEDSDNKLYFNAGTGNLLAKGELSAIYGGTCRLENDELQENQDIAPTMFADRQAATPLYRAETDQYDYPMSLADYKRLKANPYGYISYQEDRGDWKKGYIDELTYNLFKGTATFKLIPSWK